jgi:hypothetical protein
MEHAQRAQRGEAQAQQALEATLREVQLMAAQMESLEASLADARRYVTEPRGFVGACMCPTGLSVLARSPVQPVRFKYHEGEPLPRGRCLQRFLGTSCCALLFAEHFARRERPAQPKIASVFGREVGLLLPPSLPQVPGPALLDLRAGLRAVG